MVFCVICYELFLASWTEDGPRKLTARSLDDVDVPYVDKPLVSGMSVPSDDPASLIVRRRVAKRNVYHLHGDRKNRVVVGRGTGERDGMGFGKGTRRGEEEEEEEEETSRGFTLKTRFTG